MNSMQQPILPELRESKDDFIDIRSLFQGVMRRKWGILGLAVALAVLSGLLLLSRQPMYRASASVMLENREVNVVGVQDVYSAAANHMYLVNTQFDILRSRDLAERVVRKLKLYQHPAFVEEEKAAERQSDAPSWYEQLDVQSWLPWFKREGQGSEPLTQAQRQEQLVQAVTDSVLGGLAVEPVEFSFSAHLRYESTDPALAAKVANAIAEEFISRDLEVRMSGTLRATDWLDIRLDDLREKLQQSEQALQSFRDRESLVDIGGVTSFGSGELASLAQRMEEARKARIEAENIRNEVQTMGNASVEELMTLPAVLQHQLIRDLKREQSRVERRVAELGKRYGPKHPAMISTQSDLAAATRELALEVRKVVSGINREYELALRNEQQLLATWETRKSEMQEFNRKEFELRELQRQVDANRELYDVFFTRLKGISETEGFEKPHARLIDRAIVPTVPFKPNVKRGVIVALLLGLMLGCGLAVLLDLLDNTVKHPDDVGSRLGQPLLGSIPKMPAGKSGQFQQFWNKPDGGFAEAVRSIRTGVVLSSLDEQFRVVVICSTVPGEGKSTLALNLSSALGQMEKVLVIGADLRRPSLATRSDLKPNHPGLSNFISGTAKLEDCIEYKEDRNFHVMPAGVVPPNPLELISSERFATALTELRQQFDRIVIDSAPTQLVSDAKVLASYADAVIYVVKADSTPVNQVRKGIASLASSGAHLIGVVVNQFDISRSSGYYSGVGEYQYGHYYGNDPSAETT
ncbi:MAG: GumC family protein [Parahaliea sp.]